MLEKPIRKKKQIKKAPDNTPRERKVPNWQQNCQYIWLTDLGSFPGFSEDTEYVSIDFETTGLNRENDLIVGMSFSPKKGVAYYVSVRHLPGEGNVTESALLEFLQKHFSDKTIVYWNARFDRAFIKRLGFKEKAWKDAGIYSYVYDIDICARMNGSLKRHAVYYLNMQMLDIREALGLPNRKQRDESPIDFAKQPVDNIILAYACADADLTLRLFKGFFKVLEATPEAQNALNIDHRVLESLNYIETCGISVDIPFALALKTKMFEENEQILKELQQNINPLFNPSSPAQVSNYFFEILKLPVTKLTGKGNPSSDKDVLERLAEAYGEENVNIAKIVKYKKNIKALSSYISPIIDGINPRTNCAHPHYHSTTTVTGRFAGMGDGVYLKKFNGQNIPKNDLRKLFIARPGHTFVAIDLVNIEMRIITHFSKDRALLAMFEKNEDMHDFTTKLMFGVDSSHPNWKSYRKLGKTMNFNLGYAFGITRMREKLKCSEQEAWNYYNLYFRQTYKQWGNWKETTRKISREVKKTKTHFGRFRNLKYEYEQGQGAGDRASVNYPIQGTCADLLRLAMINCFKFIKSENLLDKVKMCGTIHDELTFSVSGQPGEPEFDRIVGRLKEIMEFTPKDFLLPIKAEASVGPSWGELTVWKPKNE